MILRSSTSLLAATVVLMLATAPAWAALPPFELAQRALADHRDEGSVKLAFDVTVARKHIESFRLEGKAKWGASATLKGPSGAVELSAESPTGLRLLWIALLSRDPVAALATYGFVDRHRSEVGVAGDFVYIYGSNPRVAVYRDFQRLAWFEVTADDVRWRTSLTWDETGVIAATVTRDGAPFVSARRSL